MIEPPSELRSNSRESGTRSVTEGACAGIALVLAKPYALSLSRHKATAPSRKEPWGTVILSGERSALEVEPLAVRGEAEQDLAG